MTNRTVTLDFLGGVRYLNSASDTTPAEFAARCAAGFYKIKALKTKFVFIDRLV